MSDNDGKNTGAATGGPDRQPKTAKRFFDRAAEVAATGSYDYALALYRDGLRWDPEAMDEGHRPMREVALRRKAAGGKKGGLRDQASFRRQRDPLDKMVWAEYMLGLEPDNPRYMEQVLVNAVKLDARRTARWVAIMLIEANRESAKPSAERYLAAADALEKVKAYGEAVTACELARMLRPTDQALATRVKNLAAMQTMQQGKYETADDFKDSLDNADKQRQNQEDQRVILRDDTIDRQIETARKGYQESPGEGGKIFALVDALCRREVLAEEEEAIGVLRQAHQTTGSYRYKQRLGDIRMRQYRRRSQTLRDKLAADPKNPALQRQAQELIAENRAFEEAEFAERVANYPTDMTLRYEYGRRLFANGKYDEAIPVLQHAERDPKNRLRAISLLGQAFFNLKLYREAVDTFNRGIEGIEDVGGDVSKEMFYHLGRSLEEAGQPAEADAAFSRVMQLEFNYRDVRARLQRLRSRGQDAEGGSA